MRTRGVQGKPRQGFGYMIGREWYGEAPLPFAAWLLKQEDRDERLDALIAAAKADDGFPERGTPDNVRRRLGVMLTDQEVLQALDDAELDWMCV